MDSSSDTDAGPMNSDSEAGPIPNQRVRAFKRRLDFGQDENAGPVLRSKRAMELLGGVGIGEDTVEGRPPPPPAPRYKEVFSTNRIFSYVEKAKQMELTQKNAMHFFSEAGLVETFGTSCSFQARLGFDGYALKIYIKKDNGPMSPTILPILFRETGIILQQIKMTLADIDESVKAGIPLFKYAADELIQPTDLSFWTHDHAWYSETMRFRMRFICVRKDRYFCHVNQPSDNSKFDGYWGPKLCFCRSDVDGFIRAIESITSKVDPEDVN